MDPVSDMLRLVRMKGAVYLNAEFRAPWSVVSETNATLCSSYLPPSGRVVAFHMITEGTCWARLVDYPDCVVRADAGDLLVVMHGEANSLGSAPELAPISAGPLLAPQLASRPGEVMQLSHGGEGAPTRMICGFLAHDEAFDNPVLSLLPRIFKIAMREQPHAAWLKKSLQFAAEEAAHGRSGSATVLARLSELLFVDAIRRCIDSLPPGRKGWLAAVRDRHVGRALSLLHGRPAHCWTVEELAREVGASRSGLTQRFTNLLGQPPMHYLAYWRLQVAAQEILNGSHRLAEIAVNVGYDSEAAFNRAFKREFGMPPAAWRKSHCANGALHGGTANTSEAPEAA